MRYKCDKCGDTIYVDPGDERLCDTCAQKIRIKSKEQENTMRGGEKHGEMLLLRDRSAERSV